MTLFKQTLQTAFKQGSNRFTPPIHTHPLIPPVRFEGTGSGLKTVPSNAGLRDGRKTLVDVRGLHGFRPTLLFRNGVLHRG